MLKMNWYIAPIAEMSYMRETCHVTEGLDLTKWKKNLGVILKSFVFFLISFYSRKISFEKYNLKKSGFFGINMSMNVATLQTLCIYI